MTTKIGTPKMNAAIHRGGPKLLGVGSGRNKHAERNKRNKSRETVPQFFHDTSMPPYLLKPAKNLT